MRLKVRWSLVGLLLLCASTVVEAVRATRHPRLMEMIALFRQRHPELIAYVAPTDAGFTGYKDRRRSDDPQQAEAGVVLAYMLDENEFRPHGIRSLSRLTWSIRLCYHVGGQEFKAVPARNRIPACSAATPTGGGRCGCRSMCCSCGRC